MCTVEQSKTAPSGKVKLGNKIAFACGDIFGGGSFNIINFLFTPFLTLVVGVPMVWLTPILLISKLWDGIIDPFIGKLTDGKQPGKFGKRRWFMLVFAPCVCVGMILLFFPWNLVTTSVFWKCVLVIITYMLYATAQSLVLIPYYSHASEMTDDFNERNNTNAVRLAFSLISSIICVAVPGMIASPTKGDNGVCYIIMASVFGVIFMVSILITALFSKEQIVTPAVKTKLNIKDFLQPLKVKTYRQYLGMQMCTSMAMAVMSSFFFTFCDFYLRRMTYAEVTTLGSMGSRFPIATVAAAMMFVAQIFALPFYLFLIKKKSKRFAYITGATIWIVLAALMLLLPAETAINKVTANGVTAISTQVGSPDWLLIVAGLLLGFGIGGTVFVPHSSFGDVCDVGELYFGNRTEGAFSGLTNFLNTTAQAIGLAIPPAIIGLAGYQETEYVTIAEFTQNSGISAINGMSGIWENGLEKWKYTVGNGSVQLLPVAQSDSAQLAIKLTFILLPIAIMAIGILIAIRFKLTKDLQRQIVEANQTEDKSTQEFAQLRSDLLDKL